MIPQVNNLWHLGSQPITAQPRSINCKQCLDLLGELGGLRRFKAIYHDIRREAVYSCRSACLAYQAVKEYPTELIDSRP